MEIRALLAFALSMLIITLWIAFLSPKPEPPPEKGEEATREADPGIPGRMPQVQEEGGVSVEQLASLAEKGEPEISAEQTVTIETPLYIAKIGSRGGRLLSWRLSRYRESIKDSQLIDIVSTSEGESVFPLALRVSDQIDALINATSFGFDKEMIVLSDGEDRGRLQAVASLTSGVKIVKEMVFYADRYVMDLAVSFCDEQGRAVSDELGLVWPRKSTEKSSRWAGYAGPVAFAEDEFSELKDLDDIPANGLDIQWGGFAEKYFLSAIIPLNEGRRRLRVKEGVKTTDVVVQQEADRISPCVFNYRLYLGPKTTSDLKTAGHDLAKSVDFGFFGILSKPLLTMLMAINRYTHNYGIAVIVLTIIIKLLFWPLTHKSYASMKEMQKAQPRIKQIRERFKHDKEQLNREMMLLYKTHKVNPMGGCFPMLLQFPVFIALYKALLDSIEMRHAPFFLWVKDLAAPDYLLKFPAGVSFFGIEGIGPLPLLMGASMLIQQKMTPMMGDPMQAKIMMLMPVFFTFLFISFPSGLVLYWLINNVLSIVQQVYINSRLE
jgi:YidC/Oxa1 family membrane protein insertase